MNYKNDILKIYNTVIHPGESKEVLLPMPKLYDGSPLFTHIHVIRSKNPGPVLCLTAAVHGDELNGIEIINRILKSNRLKSMSGTLVCIPIVNIYGFLYQQRYLMDRRDLNRSFPGNKKGSLAARTAGLFYQILKQCNYIIDIHTGSLHRENLPQIRANLNNNEIRDLASAFAAPVTLNSSIRPGSLREIASKNHIPLLLYEAGEALRFSKTAIKFGVRGVFNVMKHLKMINKKPNEKSEQNPSIICECSAWIRAKSSGFFITTKNLGNKVTKGDVIGHITNPLDFSEQKIITPISGVIIGLNNNALMHEGGALFNIASFERLSKKQISTMELLDNDDVESLID